MEEQQRSNHVTVVDHHQTINSRLDEIEKKLSVNMERLVEQEHRLFPVILNVYKSFLSSDSAGKAAALKALIYYLIPGGRAVIIVSGGLIIGFLTLVLMQKNNELVAASNFHLQEQIFIQANSDRLSKLAKITEYLYERDNSQEEQSNKPVPLYNRFTRTDAFNQLVKITVSPLTPPSIAPQEKLIDILLRVLCENTQYLCSTGRLENGSNKNEDNRRYDLDVKSALLIGLNWPDTTKVRLVADNANFSDANMREAFVTNASFKETKFHRTILEKAVLTESDFEKSMFDGVNLTEANLAGSNLQYTILNKTSLLGAVLADTKMNYMTITHSDLSYSVLNGAILSSASFTNVDISDTDFTGVNEMIGGYFESSNFNKAKMSNLDLNRNSFRHSTFKGTIFTDSNLAVVSFRNSDLTNANLQSTNLLESEFDGAIVENTNFHGAKNFSCEQLMAAQKWETARTDLRC